MRCEFGAASDAYRQSLAHAIRAGDTRLASEIRMRVQAADVIGPTAVSAAAPRCEETLADAEGQPTLEAGTLLQLAVFRAMDGRFEEARELLGRADRVIEELGTPMWIAAGAEMAAWVELLAGDRNEAERRERRAYALLEQRGEAAWAATHAATLARILYDQGRYDEADALTEASERHAASDDRAAQIGWRQTRSKIHARRGEHERAELLAREAADLAEGTDALDMQATALVDLAEVLRFADRRTEAVDALTRALRRYERKGNAVSAGRARTLLAQLGDGAAPAVSPSG
jgi:ATP/maltotriose-dependent transcriptional regulator MalT